ncbi:MAG TPA: energy-coupling factor transporter transmembrane component T [Gaiellaceae bacterium]
MRPSAAALVLLGVAGTALVAERLWTVGVLAAVLLAVCLRAGRRAKPYIWGTVFSAGFVFLLSPLLQSTGYHVLWSGPVIPVLGRLDVTTEELQIAGINALRLAAVGLAFAAYALLLDHDRLIAAATARRSVLAAALATRLVPTLERDAAGLVEALRGRGLAPVGLRGHAALLSPLLAGSLERGLNLAEAMEARGFGRPGRTRVPAPPWRASDAIAVALAGVLVVVGLVWL